MTGSILFERLSLAACSLLLFCFVTLLIVTIKLFGKASLFWEVIPLCCMLCEAPGVGGRGGGHSICIGDSFIADVSPWASLFKNQAQHFIARRSLMAEDAETCVTGSGLVLLFFPPRPNYYLGQHIA